MLCKATQAERPKTDRAASFPAKRDLGHISRALPICSKKVLLAFFWVPAGRFWTVPDASCTCLAPCNTCMDLNQPLGFDKTAAASTATPAGTHSGEMDQALGMLLATRMQIRDLLQEQASYAAHTTFTQSRTYSALQLLCPLFMVDPRGALRRCAL